MKRFKIAVTMGDAAGVGPEIIAKMFLRPGINDAADIFVIGDLFPMLSAQRRISKKLSIRPVDSAGKLTYGKNIIPLLDARVLHEGDYTIGEAGAKSGKASFIYLRKAIDLALDKSIDAVVTAPINKHSLHMAGLNYPGHTEILAKFTKTKNYAMMLMSDKLKVVLATIHMPVAGVPGKLSSKKITALLKLIDSSLKKDFGIKTPSIAVCGLNPHAGENGAFGDEESRIITPGIKNVVKAGVKAEGPFPADTIFHRVVNNKSHDAVLTMYHDQGLIPLKLLSFDTGVNVTLGLPIIRTSPDHGTAYDIAATGAASDVSLFEAVKTALLMAKNRNK